MEAMFACLEGSEVRSSSATWRKFSVIIKRLRAMLDANVDQPIYVPELCQALGVPERTLRKHCYDHLGMSPKKYLLLRRLNLVHQALLAADPSTTTVTEIAMNFGFWELGRFAIQYPAWVWRLPVGQPPASTQLTADSVRPRDFLAWPNPHRQTGAPLKKSVPTKLSAAFACTSETHRYNPTLQAGKEKSVIKTTRRNVTVTSLLAGPLLALRGGAVFAQPSEMPPTATSEAEQIALDAYIYGYSLITTEVTRVQMTNVDKVKGMRAPPGQFSNIRRYPPADFRGVSAPNADTLYSVAWLDLAERRCSATRTWAIGSFCSRSSICG